MPGTSRFQGDHFEELRAACKRGCIVVYAMGKEQYSGHWGELTSNIVQAQGCQGVVIDGGARDSDLQESSLQDLQRRRHHLGGRSATPVRTGRTFHRA